LETGSSRCQESTGDGRKAAKTQIGKLLDYPDHIAENRRLKLAMFDNSEEADLVLSMGRK
jgi:hypothetical protein